MFVPNAGICIQDLECHTPQDQNLKQLTCCP